MTYQSQSKPKKDSGSSLLELLVFTPLFLTFIVVVVDLGLAFQEHSTFLNAHRMLQNRLSSELSQNALLRTNGEISKTLEPETAALFLEKAVDQFIEEVEQEKFLGEESKPLFSVQAAILLLPIDANSGEVEALGLDSILLAEVSYPNKETPLSPSNIQSDKYIDPRDYITQELEDATQQIPSLYARPLVGSIGDLSAQYSNHTPLLYLETSTQASGLKRFGVYSLLGKFFTLQEQQLTALRY